MAAKGVCHQNDFPPAAKSKQVGGGQGAETPAVPAENRGGRLTCDQHPRALSILQPAPR